MARIVNLTPHPINIAVKDGRTIEIPPSGKSLRLLEVDEPTDPVLIGNDEVEVVKRSFSLPENFPELDDPDVIAIVSLPVLMALRNRPIAARIVAPDTGSGAVRDEKGNIIAVKRFVTLANMSRETIGR